MQGVDDVVGPQMSAVLAKAPQIGLVEPMHVHVGGVGLEHGGGQGVTVQDRAERERLVWRHRPGHRRDVRRRRQRP